MKGHFKYFFNLNKGKTMPLVSNDVVNKDDKYIAGW